jgi:hypothetical protein
MTTTMHLAFFALAAIGGLVLAWRAVRVVFRESINLPILNAQLLKLIAAQNVERALKLINVVPHLMYSRALAPLFEATKDGWKPEHEEAAYQARQTLQALAKKARTSVQLGFFAAICLAAATAIGFGVLQGKLHVGASIATAVGALAAASIELKHLKMVGSMPTHLEQVVAALRKSARDD